MNTNYGGGAPECHGPGAKAPTHGEVRTASTLSGYVEALFAEQYAREQMADAAPTTDTYWSE